MQLFKHCCHVNIQKPVWIATTLSKIAETFNGHILNIYEYTVYGHKYRI